MLSVHIQMKSTLAALWRLQLMWGWGGNGRVARHDNFWIEIKAFALTIYNNMHVLLSLIRMFRIRNLVQRIFLYSISFFYGSLITCG